MTLDLDLNLSFDLPEFEPENFAADQAKAQHAQKQATAHRTRSRHLARKAASEARLAEILPAVIEDGDAWHVLSQGDVDALSYLAHLLKTTAMDYVALSTWCMAQPDALQLRDWLNAGKIKRLDAYVGEIFPGQYPDAHETLCAAVRAHGGRVAVYRTHAKLFLCRAGNRAWVVESSANINTNPRAENTVITADLDLFLHHKQYLDGVKSFGRDFDHWTPACSPATSTPTNTPARSSSRPAGAPSSAATSSPASPSWSRSAPPGSSSTAAPWPKTASPNATGANMLEGVYEQLYRQQTDRQRPMAGVTCPSFKCARCQHSAPIRGRRLRIPGYSAGGYLCATCLQKTASGDPHGCSN
jgi:hypothetical protein